MITLNKERAETPAEAAAEAQAQLVLARQLMLDAGFNQVRVDQLECGPIMVETGYVYGETRLTVHKPSSRIDLRLTGWSIDQFDRFRELVMV